MAAAAMKEDGRSILRALLLMVGAMASFVTNDTFVKTLTAELPMGEIIAVRGLLAAGLIAVIARSQGLPADVRPFLSKPVMLRAGLDTLGTLFFVFALISMPIANLTAVMQIVPLVVTLIGALFLGEAVGWRRTLAIAVGFAGVLLVVKPGGGSAGLAELAALGVVLAVSVRDVVTRRIPPTVPSVLIALANAICVTAAGFVLLLFETFVPMTLSQFARLAAAALFLGAGYLFMVATLRAAPLSATAPARYSIIVFAIISGIVVFGQWPDGWAQLGIVMIVAAGLYAIARERMRASTPK